MGSHNLCTKTSNLGLLQVCEQDTRIVHSNRIMFNSPGATLLQKYMYEETLTKQTKTVVCIIPDGITSRLQPADIL